MLQTIFTTGVDGDGGLNQAAFMTIVFAIIFGWIFVSMIQRFTENLFFHTFKMDPRSTIHALIIFLLMFFLFIIFIWYIDSLEIIPVSAAATSLAEAAGGLVEAAAEDSDESATITQQLGQGWKNGHPIVLLNAGY